MPSRNDYKLRPIENGDSDLILLWRNSENVRKYMYTDHIITYDEHVKWIKKISNDEFCDYRIFEVRERSVGLVNVVQIDKNNGKCYWGFYIGVENPPSGVGSIMEFLALEYIFEELMIRKLCCEVFSFNKSVLKLHKKFGFIEEGCFKEHVLKNDSYEDVVSLALFQANWVELKPKLERIIFR